MKEVPPKPEVMSFRFRADDPLWDRIADALRLAPEPPRKQGGAGAYSAFLREAVIALLDSQDQQLGPLYEEDREIVTLARDLRDQDPETLASILFLIARRDRPGVALMVRGLAGLVSVETDEGELSPSREGGVVVPLVPRLKPPETD